MVGNGQVHEGDAYEQTSFDFETLYNLLGPLYVEGARSGDTLRIEILELTPGGWGWCLQLPEFGTLPDHFPHPYLRTFDLRSATDVDFAPGIRIPFAPFLGTMGNHPDEPPIAPAFPPHKGGGNIDARHLTIGSTLWLPVWCEGGLFSCGDPHAMQGDGEVCVAAMECDMRATLRFTVEQRAISAPYFRTKGALTPKVDARGHHGSMGIAPDLMEGTRKSVTVHNRSRPAVDSLRADGAAPASSPAEVAHRSDCVITALPNPEAVEAVVLGDDGVRDGARAGQLFIDLSTSSPALARKIASDFGELGVAGLDAPVSGGERSARDGNLTIMVGGDPDAAQRAEPLLSVFGARVSYLGPAGSGQVAKAANQIIVGLTIQAVAEGLVLAQAAGVSPAKVREALEGGFADSRVLREHGQRMLEGNFEPGPALTLHLKDLRIALGLAGEQQLSLPATSALADQMTRLIAEGHSNHDHSVLVASYEPFPCARSDGVARPEAQLTS